MCIRPYFIDYYNFKTDRCWFFVYCSLIQIKIITFLYFSLISAYCDEWFAIVLLLEKWKNVNPRERSQICIFKINKEVFRYASLGCLCVKRILLYSLKLHWYLKRHSFFFITVDVELYIVLLLLLSLKYINSREFILLTATTWKSVKTDYLVYSRIYYVSFAKSDRCPVGTWHY